MLICFDVDGTLLTDEMKDGGEYVKGVIPTNMLIDLWKLGHKIAIVSPSPYLPKQFSGDNHWFKRNSSNDYRWENINDAMIYYYTTHHPDQLATINDQMSNMTIDQKKNSLKVLAKDIIDCDKQISASTGKWGGTSNQMETIFEK